MWWPRFVLASFIPLAIVCSLLIFPGKASAQTTNFTYHGRLQDGGKDANGNYDFQFTLWDSLSGGTQQPQPTPLTVSRPGVTVSGGVFTVQLDFGVAALPGADRFLEISVRAAGGASFTSLLPRQPITSTPYAIRTLSATAADTLSPACVSCVLDGQIGSVAGSKVQGTVANADNANSATNATNATSATTANGLSSACVSCVQDGQISSVAASKVAGTVANANTANSATSATNATTANGLSNACVSCVQDGQISSVAANKIVGPVANANTANSATTASNAT